MSKKTSTIMAAPLSKRESLLSARQQAIIKYIREYIYSKGYSPSVREIGLAVGLSSSASVHSNLKKLAEFGLLQRALSKPRTIELTQESPWRLKSVVQVPLVKKITLGSSILDADNIIENYPIPDNLLKTHENIFMLKVDSNIKLNSENGIFESDYIVVKIQNDSTKSDLNDILLFFIDNELIIQKFDSSFDSSFDHSIEKRTKLNIVGKVIAVFRSL